MKATDFSYFFDFYIKKSEEYDEYEVVDYQSVFETRFVKTVNELIDCFGSMEDDYIWHDVEDTFGYEGKQDYEELKKWIETACDELLNTDLYEVVCAFASNGETIEDDVE